ncbi:hypothetical protein SRHO_G00092840 [Serrasalmus rhombeus]
MISHTDGQDSDNSDKKEVSAEAKLQYCWPVITASPLKPGFPFLFMWNAPTELCRSHFGIELDLSHFQMKCGKPCGFGLPQQMDFQEHWELAKENIIYYIPEDLPGLAVLDFEEWRPQWIRNWGNKDVYREQSVEVIMQKNLSVSYKEAQALAAMTFEEAAKKYFLKSLNLGKKLRPSRGWGYYVYPDCYNYDYNKPVQQEFQQAKLYVRHRIQEAMRVSKLSNKTYAVPVYAYIWPCFKDNDANYLSEVSGMCLEVIICDP